MDTHPEGLRPGDLPAAEILIEINRETGRVVARDAEVYAPCGSALPPELPQQVRWIVRSGLLPDELVIVFGKPLEWSGPMAPNPENVPHVEDAFVGPMTLGRACPARDSGPVTAQLPADADVVVWPYGIVVLRGRDTPLTAHPRILIRRYR